MRPYALLIAVIASLIAAIALKPNPDNPSSLLVADASPSQPRESTTRSPIPSSSRGLSPQDAALTSLSQRLHARNLSLTRIELPALAENLSVSMGDETLTLHRRSVRGPNFKVLVDNGSGNLIEATPGPVRTYQGESSTDQDATAALSLFDDGFRGAIYPLDLFHPRRITPLTSEEAEILGAAYPGPGILHAVYQEDLPELSHLAPCPNCTSEACCPDREITRLRNNPDLVRPVWGDVTVKQAEIGFDCDYEFYDRKGGKNLTTSTNLIEALVNDTIDPVYISGPLVDHVVGVIVVRTDSSTDPYRGNNDSSFLLNKIREIWNGASRPSTTHDIAQMTSGRSTTALGLAWVGVVGSSSKYSQVSTNSGDGFWRSGAKHELGHNWNLSHGDGCGEELINGSTDFGLMCGFKDRLNSREVEKVLSHRNSRGPGVLVDLGAYTPTNYGPYGKKDELSIVANAGPQVLDILANDHDCNNDLFHLERIKTSAGEINQNTPTEVVSDLGGSLIRLVGTGPDGRDQILYTPPANGSIGGTDQFHYVIRDTAGKGGSGVVTIELKVELPGVTLVDRQLNNVNDSPKALFPEGLHRQGFLNSTDVGSDIASSIRVPLNFSVRLYNSDSLLLADGYADLGPGDYNLNTVRFIDNTGADTGLHADNRVSAIRVTFTGPDRPHVELFSDNQYRGKMGIYNGEEPEATGGYRRSRLDWPDIGNDAVSSIRIPPGYSVTLYENDPYSGTEVTLTQSVRDLGVLGFNDQTSSMKITYADPGALVFAHPDPAFAGRQGWFTPGFFPQGELYRIGIDNNTITSLEIPDGWTVTLYDGDDGTGEELTLTESVEDLASLGFDNKTSSLRVSSEPLVDTDLDGLPDQYELSLYGHITDNTDGTGDFDSDGLGDVYELINYNHPTDNADANSDFDNDSLTDAAELTLHGTDPLLPDTDTDGFDDALELTHKSNPNSPSSTPALSISPAQLAGYWPFDETSGETAGDFSGHNQNATWNGDNGSNVWVDGLIGGASQTNDENGGNGEEHYRLNLNSINGTNQFSISLWFNQNVDTNNNSTYNGLFMTRNLVSSFGGGDENWGFAIEGNNSPRKIDWRVDGASGSETANIEGNNLDQWHHVLFVWDGISGTRSLYQDGVLLASQDAPTGSITSGGEWRIGDDACCGNREFTGTLDDLAVFHGSLDSDDAALLYEAGLKSHPAINLLVEPDLNLVPTITTNRENGDAILTWQDTGAASYSVLTTTNLALPLEDWTLLQNNVPATIFTHSAALINDTTRFYLVQENE